VARTRVWRCTFAIALPFAAIVLGAAAAFAATPAPGLLRATDLGASFELVGTPTAATGPRTVLTVDPAACTETLQADPQTLGVTGERFARVGAPQSSAALVELVTSYTTTKSAAASFKQRAKSLKARIKCGTVGFVPAGATTPSGTTKYTTVRFPKVGRGSYLLVTGDPGTTTSGMSVTLVSGPYVVQLNAFGGGQPPSVKELKAIAKRAVARLPVPTVIPPTTTT